MGQTERFLFYKCMTQMMKKKELEMLLEKVRPFAEPDPRLEQYPTPAVIAADIAYSAYAAGDIEGMKVLDLGCGTGMFSVAAALLGAGAVVGYDISDKALRIAEQNAADLGLDITFRQADIREVDEGADTVLMNPPFGSQNRNADRPFLEKALESAERVYSIHMANTLDFVRTFAEERGREVVSHKIYKYVIPHTFSFHTKMKQTVEIAAVVIH